MFGRATIRLGIGPHSSLGMHKHTDDGPAVGSNRLIKIGVTWQRKQN